MRSIPLFISLFCSLASSIAAAVTADTPVNQAYNYEDSTGAWQTWAFAAPGSDSIPTYQIISQGVIADSSIGSINNHSYQIEAILDTTTYLYFLLPSQLALFGSLNLNANIKVEVISGNASQAEVRLGTSLYEEAFGIYGNCPNPFGVTIDGQWKSVGGDIMPSVSKNIQSSLSGFAQSQTSDFLPYTTGPVLYIFNRAATADHQHPLRIRVTIDSVALNGTVASMSGYNNAATSAAQSYVNRISPTLTSTDQNITSAKTSIDNLSLGNQQALHNQIETEAAQFVTSHTNIVSSYSVRTPLHVPTQTQYDQDVSNQNSLTNLFSVGNYVASSGLNFLFYPWEPTGKNRLNEQTVGVSSSAPQQAIQTTLALNELEPISAVLQNLFDQDITDKDMSRLPRHISLLNKPGLGLSIY